MNRMARNRVIILVLGLVVASCFQIGIGRPEPAKAQPQAGSVRFLSFSATQVFGIAPGQTARFCVGTVSPRGPNLDWLGRILGQRGNLLVELPKKHQDAGTWGCTDVPRSSLPTSGDPLTGRAQVAACLVAQVPSGTKPSEIAGSFELVSDVDGRTI